MCPLFSFFSHSFDTSLVNRRFINYINTIKQTIVFVRKMCAGWASWEMGLHGKMWNRFDKLASHDTFVVYLVVCAFYSNHKLVNFNLRIFAERGEMGGFC